jgi:hypothetical protein
MRIGILPRFLHRWYAHAFGYAWASCPLCGRSTGGHEWRDRGGKSSAIADPDTPGLWHGICPACTRSGHGHAGWMGKL